MELRTILGETLDQLMAEDPRIVVIDADLAKANGTLFLRDKYPDRAFDVGIAEQNMASIAAGLATHGFIPFITTFAPFASRRMCDQIAISIAYANQPVKIIGSDPGIMSELNGGTHMGLEDIGVLRSIPSLTIFEPCDGVQLKQALPQIVRHDGPVYLRLHRKSTPDLHKDPDYQFDLFRAEVLRAGRHVTIAAMGALMMNEALMASEILREQNIEAEIIDLHTIKPIDVDTLITSARKTGLVVTAENHSTIGGLASAVSEVLSRKYPVPIGSVGIQDRRGVVGRLDELKTVFGMTAEDIVNKVHELIKKWR